MGAYSSNMNGPQLCVMTAIVCLVCLSTPASCLRLVAVCACCGMLRLPWSPTCGPILGPLSAHVRMWCVPKIYVCACVCARARRQAALVQIQASTCRLGPPMSVPPTVTWAALIALCTLCQQVWGSAAFHFRLFMKEHGAACACTYRNYGMQPERDDPMCRQVGSSVCYPGSSTCVHDSVDPSRNVCCNGAPASTGISRDWQRVVVGN